jgi:hypothetical protein
LSDEESARQRDQLIADLNQLQSSDAAADWVRNNLAAKNAMSPPDAERVEASFRTRVLTLESGSAATEGQIALSKKDEVAPLREPGLPETTNGSATTAVILPPKPAGQPVV